jgi:RNA polymerase sigma factor for flagellar operon FliA
VIERTRSTDNHGGLDTFATSAAVKCLREKSVHAESDALDHESLWARYKKFRALEDRDQLVVAYQHLVDRFRPRHEGAERGWFDKDDYLQAGTLGLCEAIERFNHEAGVPFEHYAARRIAGAMTDSTRAWVDWASRATRTHLKTIAVAREDFFLEQGRQPSAADVSEATGLHVRLVHELLALAESTQGGADDVDSYRDTLALPPDVEPDLWRDEVRNLPAEEKTVIVLHFLEGLALDDVAAAMNLSIRSVYKHKARGIRRIQDALLTAA